MKVMGAVCFLLLCCCSVTLANSIHPTKNVSCAKLLDRSIAYSIPPGLTGVLLKTQSSSPFEQRAVEIAEPSAFWLMILGLPVVILGMRRREGLVLPSAACRPCTGRDPHADPSFADNEEILHFSSGECHDSAAFSELEKHIIRLLLLGLRDDRISSLLHVPQHTLQQSIFRIMVVTGSLRRDEMIGRVSGDPQFVPWLRFLAQVG